VWENKEKKFLCPKKDVTSFLSNNIGLYNSAQQWGLKPPEEELVKDEIISYNEG
jgi:hypothetical protein